MKTIAIPLFENEAYVQTVAEEITDKVTGLAQKERLRIVSTDGDAVIVGKLLSYDNRADDYVGTRGNLQVKTYAVHMQVSVVFRDNVKKKDLYSGTVFAKGIYDFEKETVNCKIEKNRP